MSGDYLGILMCSCCLLCRYAVARVFEAVAKVLCFGGCSPAQARIPSSPGYSSYIPGAETVGYGFESQAI